MGLVVLDVKRKPDEFCRPCGLWKKCESPIMNGEGSEHPTWLFIGEAPGREEDEEGFPFIGDSGQLLREALEAVGIDLQKCRFSNVVRCRPPDNQISAWPQAVEHCRPHILREIRATNPKVIVILGATALRSLLNKTGILKLHGETIKTNDRTYVISFHPAYLLRNDTEVTRKRFYDVMRLAKRLGEPKKHKEVQRHHEYIRDRKMLQEYNDMLRKQTLLATDIESSTLNPFSKIRKPEVGCVGFSWDPNHAVCYPVHGRVGVEAQIKVRPEEVIEAIKDIWEDPDIKLVGHFAQHDYRYMAVVHDTWAGGINSDTGFYADTGLMHYTLDEHRGGHGLKELAWMVGMGNYDQPKRQYCMANPQHDPDRGGNLIYSPAPVLYPYNMDDCIADFRLFRLLKPRLIKQRLWELPFLFPLMWHFWTASMMEINGIRISEKRNLKLQEVYHKRIIKYDKQLADFPQVRRLQKEHELEIMEKIYERVRSYKRKVPNVRKAVLERFEEAKEKGKLDLNLNSPDNRRKLIFDIMGYEPLWKTKGGAPSAEKEVLETLNKRRRSKVLTNLITRNELVSAESKYVKPIPRWIGTDDRTHTFYRPAGTVTGRVSSDEPNHENLPKRNQLAMELRTQFVCSKGDYGILEMDKKQIEMRLFADRANDDKMIEEFNAGKDPHRMGAAAAFEIPEKDVTKEQRTDAKSAISFGILYGRMAAALAADFGWRERKAQNFIDRYFDKYDDCLEYRLERERYILKHGIVYSHFFRRRHCDGWDSGNDRLEAQAVREGINSPIQGDASDITWVAGRRLQRWLLKYKMRSKLIITVHDALFVDYFRKELEDVLHMADKFMADRKFIEKRTGWLCQVPIPNDVFLGPNLGKMTELEHRSESEFIIPSAFR
jgi:uracil-DNA glycosylase family 4